MVRYCSREVDKSDFKKLKRTIEASTVLQLRKTNLCTRSALRQSEHHQPRDALLAQLGIMKTPKETQRTSDVSKGVRKIHFIERTLPP